MNTDEARRYFHLVQAETDRDDLRHTAINGPSTAMTKAQLIQQGRDNVAFCADLQACLGTIYALADAGLLALDEDPAPTPPPEPPPQPNPPPEPSTMALPINGGVLGVTKWLAGSLGCDLFLPRHTRVPAPCACIVEEIIRGTGLQGGAELILAKADKSEAWRWRHVQVLPGIQVGTQLMRGEEAAEIFDTSLDQLGQIPAWAGQMPDGWQHVDVSYNRGTDRFMPTGGGGGNASAYQWLIANGYQGRVLQRTPGPPDAGYGLAEAERFMRPTGR